MLTGTEEVTMSAHDAGTTSRTTKPSRAHRAGILLLLALFVSPLSAVHAQQPLPVAGNSSMQEPAPRAASAPMLAGHRFVTPAIIRGPFISTYFRNGLAIGMAPGSEIPLAVIDGKEITWETGDVLFSTLQLEYQYAVKDWMGFWMNYGLAGRLGTETASLLSQGVTVTSGFRVGWLLRLMQADDMALAGTVQITKAGYTAVDLAGFVQSIIDDGLTDDDKLVHDASLMIAGAGLSYAWAINRTTGLTASGSASYGETPDRKAGNKWYFDVGGAVDFDLSRTIHAPIGAAIAARTTSVPESDLNLGNSAMTASFRLEYIGRPDLNLGLEFASQWDDIRDSDRSLRYTTVALDFRYYF
jgi:hypothetical protein